MPVSTPARGEADSSGSQNQPSDNSASVPTIHVRPRQVTWKMTRACDWKISRSRMARMIPDKEELATAEAFHLIQEIADMRVPLLMLTGGDPLLRLDLFPIVEFAARRSVRTCLALLPTPPLTWEVISELKELGLVRVAFWLHGSSAQRHDKHMGISGTYRRTLEIVRSCHEVGLPVQINTMVSTKNFHDLDSMIELLMRMDVNLWNVFFQVPANLDEIVTMLSAEQHEEIFAKLYSASQYVQFQIKTTEGQHYQRFVLQQRMRESHGKMGESDGHSRTPKGVNDSRASVFIDHRGEVYPSRFLPFAAGNLTNEPLSRLFRESSLFVSLRETSRLKGKCGQCPFNNACGGSRARAYAMTGDLFAADPRCTFEP